MKFYESGDNRKPVIFLFPGTCCLYNSFNHILDGLHSYFYTVAFLMMDLIQMRKQNFVQWKMNVKKLSRKSGKSMVAELKQHMGVPLEEVRGLRNRVFIISSILIWLRKSNMELMCREQQSTCFTQQKWEKNTKRDIVLISKIRTFKDTTCSMKNCFAVIVQSGWKK